MTQTLEELGRLLATRAEPGSVVDYEKARLLERAAPNTMNAWTHVVPLFVKLSKKLGKRTIFGRAKGAKSLRATAAGLRLVVLALYGDGKLHFGARGIPRSCGLV